MRALQCLGGQFERGRKQDVGERVWGGGLTLRCQRGEAVTEAGESGGLRRGGCYGKVKLMAGVS